MRRRPTTVATTIGGAALALAGRTRLLRWGATDQEFKAPLAGDHLIANSDLTATRAITVHASPDSSKATGWAPDSTDLRWLDRPEPTQRATTTSSLRSRSPFASESPLIYKGKDAAWDNIRAGAQPSFELDGPRERYRRMQSAAMSMP
jgi:hypothetical protein